MIVYILAVLGLSAFVVLAFFFLRHKLLRREKTPTSIMPGRVTRPTGGPHKHEEPTDTG